MGTTPSQTSIVPYVLGSPLNEGPKDMFGDLKSVTGFISINARNNHYKPSIYWSPISFYGIQAQLDARNPIKSGINRKDTKGAYTGML